MQRYLLDCLMPNCTIASLAPAHSSCTGSLFPQSCAFCLKYIATLEAVLPFIAMFVGLQFSYKKDQDVHIQSFSTWTENLVSNFWFPYVYSFWFKFRWSIFIEVIWINLALFHPYSFCFFLQAGLTGPLQKEELQLGVDAANRAAQQYQQSKDQ